MAAAPLPARVGHRGLTGQREGDLSLGVDVIDADLDRLTNEARVSIDPARRQELYRSAERLVGEDCPLIPLYHDRSYAAANPKVQGLRLHQTPPTVRFDQLWLDSAES